MSARPIGAVNFPQVQLPPRPTGTRFIQVHKNLPGEISRLNAIFAAARSTSPRNISRPTARSAMSCSTPTARSRTRGILKEIRALAGTVRARMLYSRS